MTPHTTIEHAIGHRRESTPVPAASASPALPVLYSFRRCPYAMRARLALLAAGERCELREVVLRDKPAELAAVSPKATVPVLVMADGTVLDQSLDIMLWALRRHDPHAWLAPCGGTLADMMELIDVCDRGFKPDLDRYKYPERHRDQVPRDPGEADPLSPRERGVVFLRQLDARLARTRYLAGDGTALADAAIAPFVRQFAKVDAEWFAAQPWPRLQAWLAAWEGSAGFARVMHRYAAWKPGDAVPVLFPWAGEPVPG